MFFSYLFSVARTVAWKKGAQIASTNKQRKKYENVANSLGLGKCIIRLRIESQRILVITLTSSSHTSAKNRKKMDSCSWCNSTVDPREKEVR